MAAATFLPRHLSSRLSNEGCGDYGGRVSTRWRNLALLMVAVVVFAASCTRTAEPSDDLFGSDARPTPEDLDSGPIDSIPDAEVEAVSAEESYQWEVLSSGAGGFVTGLTSNADGSVRLARTDVGGAYRWNDDGRSWHQLISYEGVAEPVLSDWTIESIAVAPSDPTRFYLSTGKSEESSVGRILRSSDAGETWTASAQRFAIHGNGDWRTSGERLAVDPNDSDTVLLGTRTEGLWRSVDGGESFAVVDSVPVGANPSGVGGNKSPAGVMFVEFSADGATVWAGVSGVGLLRSLDQGVTWSTLIPSSGMPYDADIGADGRLWVVQRNPGQVWIIDGDVVSEITPEKNKPFQSVTVDPFDPDRAIVGGQGIAVSSWVTTDSGQSWDDLEVSTECSSIPWLDAYPNDFLPTGSLRFDRNEQNQVWVPEGFAVWLGTLAGNNFDLVCESRGIEELVSNDVIVPPGGSPITAHWDRGLFLHDAEQSETAVVHPANRFNSSWDLDWTPADSNFVVAVLGDQRPCCREEADSFLSGYSNDGGRTWTPFGSYETAHPTELVFGNIAVAANDTTNLVWLPTFNGAPHASTDGGETWTPVILPGTEEILSNSGAYSGGSHFQYYLNRKVLVADRVQANTFYLYHRFGLFRSVDGGFTWDLMPSGGLPSGGVSWFSAQLVASPTEPGHLVFSPGIQDSGPIPSYESRDGGATWTLLPGLADVAAIGFGAPVVPDGDPVVFLSGVYSGEQGIWRSTDGLVSWELISRAPMGNYQAVRAITGDLSEPGTVYVGFTGTSFMVGRFEPIENG